MAAMHVDDKNFKKEVLDSKIPVVVDFYADWCGPCKMAAPIIDELSGEYKGKVKIVKMDVDSNRETPMKYQVMSIPTVIAFKNGEEVEKKIGFGGREGYVDLIKKVS